jgi:hypothetical protein
MGEANGVWTSEQVALVLIGYQKEMFENVRSETAPDEIDLNVRSGIPRHRVDARWLRRHVNLSKKLQRS